MNAKTTFLTVLLAAMFGGCNNHPPEVAVKPSACELPSEHDSGSAWEFSEKVNEMDGTTTSIASLDGELIIRCHGESLRTNLLCDGGQLDAYLLTNDIIDDESPSVRVRFDNGQPSRQTWSRSTDYKAMFAPRPRQFVADLIKSTDFFIEYPPYQKMPETIRIHVKGLGDSTRASDVDSFLRGLTRDDVMATCGRGHRKDRVREN